MGPGTASLDLRYLDLSIPNPLMLTNRYSQPQPLSTLKSGPYPHFIRFGEDMRLKQSPSQNAAGSETQFNSSIRALVRH